MSRADDQAAYRAEVEAAEADPAVFKPDYCKIPRDVWAQGFALSEAKRAKFLRDVIDMNFTGIDPTPVLGAEEAPVFKSVAWRIRKARNVSKASLSKRQNQTDFDPKSDHFCTKNATDFEQAEEPKPKPKTSAVNGNLPAETAPRPIEVTTEVENGRPSEVITTNYYRQTTTDVTQTPLKRGLGNGRVEGLNLLDTQPDTPAREDRRPFTRPTPEQVQGWWGMEGREWAGTDEGARAARDFIAEQAGRVNLPERKRFNPVTNPYDPEKEGEKLERAWRGLASVWAGAYEVRRADA